MPIPERLRENNAGESAFIGNRQTKRRFTHARHFDSRQFNVTLS